MKALANLLLLVIAVVGLAGCGAAKEGGGIRKEVEPRVTVVTPSLLKVEDFVDVAGWTQAAQTVEVRAPVPGILIPVTDHTRGKTKDFAEGSLVTKGDLLFVLGQRPEVAGDVMSAELEERWAEARLDRVKQGASSSDLSNVKEAVEVAKSRLAKARAELQCAEIRAPIAGTVGRRMIGPGNLVGSGDNSLLTTIVVQDPIYVFFNLDESSVQTINRWRRENSGNLNGLRVAVGLPGEEATPHDGRLDYVDTVIDRATGSALARAVLPNPEGIVVPGMAVRARLYLGGAKERFVIDERALGTDSGGKFVFVVSPHNRMVDQRYVKLGGSLSGGKRVILNPNYVPQEHSGLEPDDRYIIEGLQLARVGRTVTPLTPEEALADKQRGAKGGAKPGAKEDAAEEGDNAAQGKSAPAGGESAPEKPDKATEGTGKTE